MGCFIVLFWVAILAIVIVNFAQIVSLGLQYLDHYTNAPDFWSLGNFWAVVAGIVGVTIISVIAQFAFELLGKGIIGLVSDGAKTFSKDPRKGRIRAYQLSQKTAVIMYAVFSIAALFTTIWLFNTLADYPDLTNYFVHGNWIAFIMMWITFHVTFIPTTGKTPRMFEGL